MTLCWLHYREGAAHLFCHDGERKPPRRYTIFYLCEKNFFRKLLSKSTWIKLEKLGTSTHPRSYQVITSSSGFLPDTQNWRLCMRRERFSRHRFQRKPLVNNLGIHHGTSVTRVPWCMSGSLTRGGGKHVPGIHGACATHNFALLVRGPCRARSRRSLPAH